MLAVSRQCHTGGSLFAGCLQVLIIQFLLLGIGTIAADDDHILMTGSHIERVQHLIQGIYRLLPQTGFCAADMVVVRLVVVNADDL